MAKSYKRRKLLIKKDYQGKLILGCFLLITGAGLLLNVLLGLLPTDSLALSSASQNLQIDQTPFKPLKTHWSLLVIGGGFVVIAALLLSHRIAGPMFRFEMTLDNMMKGRLDNTIRLRNKDEGKELARKINEFNSQLSRSFSTISHNSQALQTLIEQASTLNLPEKEKEQLASLCWSMQEHNRKIIKDCNFFCGKNE